MVKKSKEKRRFVRRTRFNLLTALGAVTLVLSLGTLPVPTQAEAEGPSASVESPDLSFGVMSDIHLHSAIDEKGIPVYDFKAESNFRGALQDLHAINPKIDALVIDGDFTDTGMQTDYDSLKKLLDTTPHPKNTLFAIGNHEFFSAFRLPSGVLSRSTFPNGVTEQDCIERFLKNTGMPGLYYDQVIKGYHFIVLGSEQSRITNPDYGDRAVLSDTQLLWLDHVLKHIPSNQPTFVFLHQPLPHTDEVSGDNALIVDPEKLINSLIHYPQVILFSGHSHFTLKNQPNTMYQNQFTMFNNSSVRKPITPNNQSVGGSEGLAVQVYKDKVVVGGRDFAHKKWIVSYVIRAPFQQPLELPIN